MFLVENASAIVYNVATALVTCRLDRQTPRQRHWLGHSEEISCLTLDPSRQHMASGQLDPSLGLDQVRIHRCLDHNLWLIPPIPNDSHRFWFGISPLVNALHHWFIII